MLHLAPLARPRRLLGALLDYLFPPVCLLCGMDSGTSRHLCEPCRRDLPWIRLGCPGCGLGGTSGRTCGRCLQRPPPWSRVRIPLEYRFPVAELILGFKLRDRRIAGRLLAQLAAEAIAAQEGPLPEVLLPVPLHPEDQRRRGFNQAEVIARVMGAALNLPVDAGRLSRTRRGPSQKSLGRRARQRNLEGSFASAPAGARARVALVDDVVTTGATASTLTRLLLDSGAESVELWALARTPYEGRRGQPDPQSWGNSVNIRPDLRE